MFCQNKLCRCHVECEDTTVRLCYTEGNGNTVNVRRHLIRRMPDEAEFMFCETCANVAAMIHGKEEVAA